MDSLNHLKSSSSSSEDQIDMMLTMMMQLPEFSCNTNTINQFPPSDHTQFYNNSNNNTRPLADLIDNHHNHHHPNPNFVTDFTHLPSQSTTTNTITFTNDNSTTIQPPTLMFSNPCNVAGIAGIAGNYPYNTSSSSEKRNSMAAMRDMIFRIAAMQPIYIDPESVKAPKRRNVKISKDPQSIAARHRRERISEKIRILQRMVPGGTKMDTASMLDEAIHYVKFLKTQVKSLQERASVNNNRTTTVVGSGLGFPVPLPKPYQ